MSARPVFQASARPALADAGDVLPSAAFLAAPVWRAGELAHTVQHTLDTGYPELNAVLPGGGWPLGAMTELLQAQPGLGEWGLLAPALAHAAPGVVVLVGAPFVPCGPALVARQLNPCSLLRVQVDGASARLWAAEQSLRCADVLAVLAWLPKVPMPHLRRLHMAAQTHGKLLFVFRPETLQGESSPAPLRLRLMRSETRGLLLDVFKRRGPPLAQPLALPTLPLRLEALLAASRAQAQQRRQVADRALRPRQMPTSAALPRHIPAPAALPQPLKREETGHVVDRLARAS